MLRGFFHRIKFPERPTLRTSAVSFYVYYTTLCEIVKAASFAILFESSGFTGRQAKDSWMHSPFTVSSVLP